MAGLLGDWSGFVGDDTTKDEWGMTQADRREPLWSGLIKAGLLAVAGGGNLMPEQRAQYLAQAGGALADIPNQMVAYRSAAAQQALRRQQMELDKQKVVAGKAELEQAQKWREYANSPEFQQTLDQANASPAERMAAKAAALKGDFGSVQKILDPSRHRPKVDSSGFITHPNGDVDWFNPLTGEAQPVMRGGKYVGKPGDTTTPPQPPTTPRDTMPEFAPGSPASSPPTATTPPPTAPTPAPPPVAPPVASADLPLFQIPGQPPSPLGAPPSLPAPSTGMSAPVTTGPLSQFPPYTGLRNAPVPGPGPRPGPTPVPPVPPPQAAAPPVTPAPLPARPPVAQGDNVQPAAYTPPPMSNAPPIPQTVHTGASFDQSGDATKPIPDQPPQARFANYDQAFLQTLNPAMAAKVQAIAEYREKPLTVGARGGSTGILNQQIMAAVRRYSKGTYDDTMYDTVNKLRKEYSSGTTGKNMTAINTVYGHIGDLYDAGAVLANNNPKVVQGWVNKIREQVGGEAGAKITSFDTAKTAVGDELARAMKGSAMSDKEIERWESLFSNAKTPEQLQAAVAEAYRLLDKREKAVHFGWKSATGFDYGRDFISPENRAKRDYVMKNPLRSGGGTTTAPGGGGATPNPYETEMRKRGLIP